MAKKVSKFLKLKESVISLFSILIILLLKNLYENGILHEAFMRTFKGKLSLISLKQSQAVRLQQRFCQSKTSAVSYEVPDLSSVDRTLLETRQSLGFLLETSNRSSLSVRQGCAVESCARHSGRVCLLLVHTARLNVCDQKVSVLFSVPNVLVFHLNVSLLTHMTPLEKMFKDGRVETSCCKTIHFSDILRLAVLYR